MTALLQNAKKEMSAREFKRWFNDIMQELTDMDELSVTVSFQKESKTMVVYPKVRRHRGTRVPIELHHIPFSQLKTVDQPGAYLTMDSIPMGNDTTASFHYGLFINYQKERDLRFFTDAEGALEWLNKKIKAVKR